MLLEKFSKLLFAWSPKAFLLNHKRMVRLSCGLMVPAGLLLGVCLWGWTRYQKAIPPTFTLVDPELVTNEYRLSVTQVVRIDRA